MKSKVVLSRCQSRKFSVEMPLRPPARRLFENPHDPLGIGIREWLQQEAVDKAGNGRVRADPQRERENRHDCEAGAVAQSSQRVAQILNERGHEDASYVGY